MLLWYIVSYFVWPSGEVSRCSSKHFCMTAMLESFPLCGISFLHRRNRKYPLWNAVSTTFTSTANNQELVSRLCKNWRSLSQYSNLCLEYWVLLFVSETCLRMVHGDPQTTLLLQGLPAYIHEDWRLGVLSLNHCYFDIKIPRLYIENAQNCALRLSISISQNGWQCQNCRNNKY